MYDTRLWKFVADMNYSGSITVSDVWLWFLWLFFYVGDGLLYFMMFEITPVAEFFEITTASYGGIFSGLVSGVFWIAVWFVYILRDDIF
jgi:hypothetical protein